MAVDEIVILANSFKHGGRCVAGISMRSDDWVRPVSTHPHGELYPYHYRVDGQDVELLDVVGFEHGDIARDPCQPENVEVGDGRWWRTGRLGLEDAARTLRPKLADGPRLLGNRGAAMPEEEALRGVDASLALVWPEEVEFRLDPPREGMARLRPRVKFTLGDQDYDLPLTDTSVRPKLIRKGLGTYDCADLGLDLGVAPLLTVSLAEPREGWCTKLVAAVMPTPWRSQ
jgi:hypothetical protein